MSGLGLIVTDASPLITLAAGDALHLLLIPRVPILIPDMIYVEVTRDLSRLGADAVVRWLQENRHQVSIVATETFAEYQALLTINPQTRLRGRGEQAALDVLEREVASHSELRAILLFEDSDVQRRRFSRLLPERVAVLSTGDFLRELESAGRIQSCDAVLDAATARGRNVARLRSPVADEPTRTLLRDRLTDLGLDEPETR